MTRFQFLVRRLQQHTKYEVVVQAVNTHGEGPLSPVTVAQTREAGEATVTVVSWRLELETNLRNIFTITIQWQINGCKQAKVEEKQDNMAEINQKWQNKFYKSSFILPCLLFLSYQSPPHPPQLRLLLPLSLTGIDPRQVDVEL